MKARIERRWVRDDVAIWLYGDAHVQYIFGRDGSLLCEPISPGVMPEPSLVLSMEALEALLDASGDVVTPSRVASEALQDARVTRDRVLAIVEKLTDTEVIA